MVLYEVYESPNSKLDLSAECHICLIYGLRLGTSKIGVNGPHDGDSKDVKKHRKREPAVCNSFTSQHTDFEASCPRMSFAEI
jgi:hypothetical protein